MSILCAFGFHQYLVSDAEYHIRRKKAKCFLDIDHPRAERVCIVTSLCRCCGKTKYYKSICELGDWQR